MINIIFGILLIVAGLSGKFALIGTQSGTALAALGGVLLVIGIFQVTKGKSGG